MLPTKFRFIWASSFRGEKKNTHEKQELPMAAMFLTDWDNMSSLYRGHSIHAAYQIAFHLGKRF
jgi:hypothetical protein